MSQLKMNDTDFVTTDRDILSECTAFYKNLYTSKKKKPTASSQHSSLKWTPPLYRMKNKFYEIDPRPLSFYGLISAVKSIQIDSNFQDLQNTNHEKEPLTTESHEAIAECGSSFLSA